ncbi:MAG: hypothetical protein ABL996_07250 [Micropepsaceae bacterium]
MTQDGSDDQLAERLATWRQGDYALDVGGFLFADVAEADGRFDAREADEDVQGMVVVSQTCDVIRLTPDKRFVAVSPLVKRDAKFWNEITVGRFPSLTLLEHPPSNGIFVDLARIMSVSKPLLASWPRQEGFTTAERAVRFAAAIERKMGRFAFPDAFDVATKELQNRVRSRHNKPDSDVGKVYRSIDQLRFLATPHWEAEAVEVTMIAVLHSAAKRLVSDRQIFTELDAQCKAVRWQKQFRWADPAFYLATADDLRGSDILNSQLADFEYLSG